MKSTLHNDACPAVNIAAVLLAAGESRRMGDTNKLSLPIGGQPLLRRTAELLLVSRVREIVVVTGHQAQASEALLQGLALRVVHNENYRDGQMSSVHQGLDALSIPCDGVMICLADQPLLEVADLNQLIDAFAQSDRESVLVPTYQGKRGNPIILAEAHRAAILAGKRNLGCKRLIENNPDMVATLEMPNDHVLVDMDTPDDYAALGFATGGQEPEPADKPAKNHVA